MELLEMIKTGSSSAASNDSASIVESIVQLTMVAAGSDVPSDFDSAIRETLLHLDGKDLATIKKKISSFRTDDLRVFGNAVYSLSHRDEDQGHQLPANAIAVPFYAECAPTAVTFGVSSVESATSVLNATLGMEYSLLLHEVDPRTALAMGRAAVMCRSISGGMPLAVGGVFGSKFVSPYSGTVTFTDLIWLGRLEKSLAPHAEYLRTHRTYDRRFIENILANGVPKE